MVLIGFNTGHESESLSSIKLFPFHDTKFCSGHIPVKINLILKLSEKPDPCNVNTYQYLRAGK
jgi:hypothetical protein